MRYNGAAAGPQFSSLKSQFCFCNTVIVIYLRDVSTLPHILFLQIQSLRRDAPLEMTVNVKRHIAEMGFVKCGTIPNSSFRAVAACYMTLQSRIPKASMSREIFLAFGNTGFFIFIFLSRFAANAPPQPSAAHPTGKRLTTICASLRSFKSCSLPPRRGSQGHPPSALPSAPTASGPPSR